MGSERILSIALVSAWLPSAEPGPSAAADGEAPDNERPLVQMGVSSTNRVCSTECVAGGECPAEAVETP
jgi:hypothetical protein